MTSREEILAALNKSDSKSTSFFGTFFGLIVEPGHTTERLLSEDQPPHVGSILFLFLFTIFAPLALQLYQYGTLFWRSDGVASLLLVLSLTLLIFVLAEALFLVAMGIDITLPQLIASVVYSIVPLIFALWLLYGFNYLTNGSLTLLKLLLYGDYPMDDNFVRVLPLAFVITMGLVFLVFFNCIKSVGQLYSFTAGAITLFSAIPLITALAIGVYLGEFARPGTLKILMDIFLSPKNLTYFKV